VLNAFIPLAAVTAPSPLMQWVVWPGIKFLVAFAIVLFVVAAMTLVERRFLAFLQARLGPNRVGPWGLLQFVADPIKLLLKEDIVPSGAQKFPYFIAPWLPLIPALTVFAIIPVGPPPAFEISSVNIGILLVLALTSTGVYGLILGGWASNNKFSLMGGLRSAAQMVSYEVPFGLSIIGLLMLAGTLNLSEIVRYQEQHLWFVIPQIIAFFIFLVAMVAENNRSPFDLPEAESEIVAGYHTEYSGMKFAFFFLAEYAAMLVNSALVVVLFFGGWTLAMGGWGLTTEVLTGWGALGAILGGLIFFTKVMFFMLLYVWLRGTFPRYRFDQLMSLGWKWMIPLALVNIAVTGLVVLLWGSKGI
jgi:NADH-quinone oxidoreductase subunit H